MKLIKISIFTGGFIIAYGRSHFSYHFIFKTKQNAQKKPTINDVPLFDLKTTKKAKFRRSHQTLSIGLFMTLPDALVLSESYTHPSTSNRIR